ncbi:unnamed protein product [Psylliodes chrysocephalus]|uniref:DUF4430 domain-containing protein n=1 Tax=Psylliodes chrysocephalus TaxID=3402493 RepID=A0A9P0GA11_9CUCU|nr:unnamed protein product [Psylliodes chrysocephala]
MISPLKISGYLLFLSTVTCLVVVLKSEAKQSKTINVPYTLWVYTPVNYSKTIKVAVPFNTTFYDVMLQAQLQDPVYNFTATPYDWGMYIDQIAGYQQNNEKEIYWWIYDLDCKPDMKNPPDVNQLSPVGVSEIRVKKGRHYLFWYRHIENTH